MRQTHDDLKVWLGVHFLAGKVSKPENLFAKIIFPELSCSKRAFLF
jgi:hypothetical protein